MEHIHTPGGYLYTSDGFLPPDLRPDKLVYQSNVAASNNGASLPYSFANPPATLPVPPAGYILSITNAGAIVVQCAGTFGNIIPPGPQILMPTTITYKAASQKTLQEYQVKHRPNQYYAIFKSWCSKRWLSR